MRVEKLVKDILYLILVSFYKVKVFVDLVKYFSWSVVLVMYLLFYKDDFEFFWRILRIENLCIVVEVVFGIVGKIDNF